MVIHMNNSNVQSELPIEIRPIIDSDIAFIFSSWLRAYRNSYAVRDITQNVYYSEQHKIVERCITKGSTLVLSALEDPATIYGYLNFEIVQGQFVLHFAYIKQDFRKLGLFKSLLKATKHDFTGAGLYTHRVPKTFNILESKYNLIYHPYILINY